MKKKSMTIDRLAVMTQNEFRRVDERFDRLDGRVDRLDDKIDRGFKAIVDVLDVMRSDLHDVKISIGPLVRTVAALETTVRHLDKRITRLEEKTGFTK